MSSILSRSIFRVLFFSILFLLNESVVFSIDDSSYSEAFEPKAPNKKQKRKNINKNVINKNIDKNKDKDKDKDKNIFEETDHEKQYTVKAARSFLSALEYTRAFIILKKLLDKNPDDKEVNFLLGRIYTYSKEYKKAVFYFLKGSDYYLDSSSGYDYGVSFYMIKDYPRAIKGFRKVDDNSSLKNIVNFYIGVCYLEMNKLPLALLYLRNSKDLPSNYKNIQDKYIQYIEANLNTYDQKLAKKRIRKITRKELPPIPRMKKDKLTKSISVDYEASTKKAKEESRWFEITPFLDQSINMSKYEYSTEVLSSSYYKYQGGLKLKLEPVFSSSAKRPLSFSIPLDLSVDSYGLVMFSSDTPTDDEEYQSLELLKPSSTYMYKSSSDLKYNSSLKLKISPRVEVPIGKIASFWTEYDYTYGNKAFDPENADYTQEVWLGVDKIGSNSLNLNVSSGFESFLTLDAEYPAHVVTSNLSLVFGSSSTNKFKLSTDFYYGLEKEGKEEDATNYRVCIYDSSSKYICDGINSWIGASYNMSNSAVSFGINLEYALPLGEQERKDASSISVNSNFKFIGSKYFSLYTNIALSNLTLDSSVYETSSGFSITPVSVLYLNLDLNFKYLTQYEYKLYAETLDSYETKITSDSGYSIKTTPSISFEPLKWLTLGVKFEYVYNEFNIPEEDVDMVYFWYPDDGVGADYSHYNLVFNIKLSYTF